MKNRIRIKERMRASDIHGLMGELIFGISRIQIPFIDPFGNQSSYSSFKEILYRAQNIIPIGGYQFVFNKMFNIGPDKESTLRVGDLNDEAPMMKIGVPRDRYINKYYNAEVRVAESTSQLQADVPVNAGINISSMNHVFGFMIGDGGAREDNVTAIAPDYKRRTLYRAVPFRMSNDGGSIPQGKYFGKNETFQSGNVNKVTSYFIKTFDSPPPRIIHSWVSENLKETNIVDDTVFASTSSIPIESYVEMNLSVDAEDARGFFTTTNSSPRINEFGLVSGWYNTKENDYESLRLITHFTRPAISLSEGDSIEAIYRIFNR
jgi:hypothetical protein